MYALEKIRHRLKEHSKLQLLDLALDKLSLPTRFNFYFSIWYLHTETPTLLWSMFSAHILIL